MADRKAVIGIVGQGVGAMKAKVLVQVERNAALDAIRTLDALGAALHEHERHWPKHLKRQYKQTRQDLAEAVGGRAYGIGKQALPD
jgi:hypothetical protein